MIVTVVKFLSWIGEMASLLPTSHVFDIEQELETFSRMMKDQVDLRIEHSNLVNFSQNFSSTDQIQFPVPIKSNQNVLLESFAYGIHLKEFMSLETPFNDEIVNLGLKTVVKMILKDNFLHADLHPGNILVSFKDKSNQIAPSTVYDLFYKSEQITRLNLLKSLKDDGFSANLVVLDAGLVTKLSEKQYSSLVNVTNAALDSDSVKMANIFVSESKNPQGVLDQKSLQLKLCKMLHNASLEDTGTLLFSKLNAANIVGSFVDLVRDHNLLLYGEYIGLLVSCLTVEGIGKSLAQNDFDLLPILSEAVLD
jgi:aarF domain-containing kinase